MFSFCSRSCVAAGEAAHWVLAYAWNPLLATEVAGSGHIDIVGVLLLLVSVAALRRRWRTVAAVAFALAVAVKLLPIVLLPLYWRRVRVRDGALAAAVFGLLYLPFLNHGRIPIGSLGTYVQSFRFNDPVFAVVERVAAPQLAVGLALLAGFLTAIWMRRKSAASSSGRICLAHGSVASMRSGDLSVVPAVAFAVRAVGLHPADHHLDGKYSFRLTTCGICAHWDRPWLVPGWIMLLEYGSVAAAAALLGWRRCKQIGTMPGSSTD